MTFTARFTRSGEQTVTAKANGKSASATVRVKELSGRAWVNQFPTSTDTADLTPQFRDGVDRFIAALRAAGARVTIQATYRPRNGLG